MKHLRAISQTPQRAQEEDGTLAIILRLIAGLLDGSMFGGTEKTVSARKGPDSQP